MGTPHLLLRDGLALFPSFTAVCYHNQRWGAAEPEVGCSTVRCRQHHVRSPVQQSQKAKSTNLEQGVPKPCFHCDTRAGRETLLTAPANPYSGTLIVEVTQGQQTYQKRRTCLRTLSSRQGKHSCHETGCSCCSAEACGTEAKRTECAGGRQAQASCIVPD